MEKKQITKIAMTGKELLKSAGLNQNHIYSLLDGLRQEWDRAMIRPSGAYSVGYVEEKLSKILDCFKDIDKEKARLAWIANNEFEKED